MSPYKKQLSMLAVIVLTAIIAAAGYALFAVSTRMLSNRMNEPEAPSFNTITIPDTQLVFTETDIPAPAWLGIIGATDRPEMAQAMNLPAGQTGVLVHLVESYSPAQQANIGGSEQYVTVEERRWLVGGDIITAYNNIPVNTMQDLHNLLAQAQPGEEIILTILRDGQESRLNITLATYPNLELTTPVNGLQTT